MEASDMLDIIHYYFEDDMNVSTAEAAEANSKLRVELYKLYGVKYKYALKDSGSSSSTGGRKYITDSDNSDFGSDLGEFGSDSNEVKEYFDPTDFNPDSPLPFGGTLDAPLG